MAGASAAVPIASLLAALVIASAGLSAAVWIGGFGSPPGGGHVRAFVRVTCMALVIESVA